MFCASLLLDVLPLLVLGLALLDVLPLLLVLVLGLGLLLDVLPLLL